MAGIINHQIGMAVQFTGVFHVFWAGRGTGTTYLKANLLQKLTEMRGEVLYRFLLEIRKSYKILDR